MPERYGFQESASRERSWAFNCKLFDDRKSRFYMSRKTPPLYSPRTHLLTVFGRTNSIYSENRSEHWQVVGLSSWRHGFNSTSVRVGIMVNKVAMGQDFIAVLLLSPVCVTPFNRRSPHYINFPKYSLVKTHTSVMI